MKTINKLKGKTIKKAWVEKAKDELGNYFDDEPFLFLKMTDGTMFKITATYGSYTGESQDEYPSFVIVEELIPTQDEAKE